MPERKLRMLIVGAFPPTIIVEHGGILTSCRVLLSSSLPRRMDLTLVDSSSPTLPPPPFWNRLVRAAQRVTITVRHFVRARPDIVLLFASPGSSFLEKSITAFIARLFGVKSLMFPRGAQTIHQYRQSRAYAALLRLCFRASDLMLCQGMAYQEFFTREVGLDPARCPVIHNWTATDQLLGVGTSRSWNDDDQALEVLFLGWLEREKGIFELLESARILSESQELPPFKIVIAGDGAAKVEAVQRIAELGLGDVVQLLGWIDSEAKIDRLKKAHLLVLPSYVEGMPNSVIEAMAAGLPVVATEVGAVRDAVVDGVSGFVVPPRDVEGLTEALRRLLVDRELRQRMGHAGWLIAREKFGVEGAVDTLVELTERLCRSGQSMGNM